MTNAQFCLILALLFYITSNVERRGPSRLAWYLAFLLAIAVGIIQLRAESQPTTWTIPDCCLTTPT